MDFDAPADYTVGKKKKNKQKKQRAEKAVKHEDDSDTNCSL